MLNSEKEHTIILLIAQQLQDLTIIEICNILDKTEKLLDNVVGDFDENIARMILQSWDMEIDNKICESDCILKDYTYKFYLYENIKTTTVPYQRLCYKTRHENRIKPFTKANIITSYIQHPWEGHVLNYFKAHQLTDTLHNRYLFLDLLLELETKAM